MFYSNKVRVGLLEIIDRLTISDFTADSAYWKEEEKKLLLSSKSNPTTYNTSDTVPETLEKQPLTFEDLHLFKAQHSSLLSYFPVLYRQISGLIVRGSLKDDVTVLLNDLNENLQYLQQFKTVLSALEDSKNKISALDKSEYYKLLLDKFVEFKSRLDKETLNTINPKLVELNKLSLLLHSELTPN